MDAAEEQTPPFLSSIALRISVVVVVGMGTLRNSGWSNFALPSGFDYLETEDLTSG